MKKDYDIVVETSSHKDTTKNESNKQLEKVFDYIVNEIGMKDEHILNELTGE